jgi:2-dehydro-3-deoxy-D-arabinonate dehydratase
MQLVRFISPDQAKPSVGLRYDDGRVVRLEADSMSALLQQRRDALLGTLLAPVSGRSFDSAELNFLPPIDHDTEVWASGVTYLRSREARIEESRRESLYSQVYEADRPELFFKSVAWRLVTDDEPIGIRTDSSIDVPEAELAVLANFAGEIIGYTICNDVSSRSIEAENPLYLPQAKIYAGACAVYSGIELAVTDVAPSRQIECAIFRQGREIWSETTSTARLRRNPEDLLRSLYSAQSFPHGVLLSTGTGLVPPIELTLLDEDETRISIEGIGTLRNPVRQGRDAFDWLHRRPR